MIIASVVAVLTAIPALLWPTEPSAADARPMHVLQPLTLGTAPHSPDMSRDGDAENALPDLAALQPSAAGPGEGASKAQAKKSAETPVWEMPVAKMMGVELPESAINKPDASDSDQPPSLLNDSRNAGPSKKPLLKASDLDLKPRLRPAEPKSITAKGTSPKQIASKSMSVKRLTQVQENQQPDFFGDASDTGDFDAGTDVRRAALQLTLPGNTAKVSVTKEDQWESYKVRKGDSLWKIFARMGLNDTALSEVMQAGSVSRTFNRIRPGDQLELIRTANGAVYKLRYMKNELEGVIVSRASGRLKAEELILVPEIIPTYAAGSINDSLFVDAKKAGLSDSLIMQLVSVFGWDIDFALDIRRGDSFGILYEQKILDGKQVGVGKILAAHFTNRGRAFNAIHYTDSSGHSGYYTPDGRSMRKAFLRTPVEFARVSSHFNLRRKHPVLHTIRAHKGVDYAASRGTPIRASGDGKIAHKGRKGGYGRTVIIEHGNGYRTLYAHLNGYKRGMKKGAKVRQGDVIGYVGSSGLATGPHLHYEFHVHGRHKNPLTVAFPKAKPIPERERRKFLAHATKLTTQLASMRTTRRVAMRKSAN